MGPPTFNSIGSETIITENRVLKAGGLEHVTASIIFDDGTNVGIGTTSLNTKLTVNGAATISGSSTIIGNLTVGRNSNSSTAARIDLTAGGNGFDSLIDFGYYDTFDANIWNVGRKGSTGAFFISNQGSGAEVNVITINTSNNVGIGTTSPTAKFHVTGSTGGVFEVDTANATTTLYVSASGNVGIGTASPAQKLDVSGSIAIAGTAIVNTSRNLINLGSLSNDANTGFFNIIDSGKQIQITDGTRDLRINSTFGGSSAAIGTVGSHDLNLFTANSFRVTIKSDGNVGIGTTSPNTRLQVSSNIQGGSPSAAGTATTSSAYFTNSDPAYGILMGVLNAGHGWIQAQRTDTLATTYNLLLNPNGGNVGIGTTSPAYALDVNGGIRGDSWIGRSNIATPTADAALFRPADNSIALSTANTERARITAGGNLLLGTTSDAAGFRFSTNAGASTNGHLIAGSTTGIYSNWSDGTATDSPQVGGIGNALVIRTSSTERVRIDSSGNFGIGTTRKCDRTITYRNIND